MPTLRPKKAATQPTTPPRVGKNPPVLNRRVEASPASTGSTAVPKATQNEAVAQPRDHPPKKFAKDPQVKETKAFTDSTAVPKATQNEAVAQPLVHPLKKFAKDPQMKEMKAFCYNCQEEVIGSKVLGHLFFGKLKCVNCCYTISWCSDFEECYPSKEKCPKEATHRLVAWEQPLKDFLFYCASRQLTIDKYCNVTSSLSGGNDLVHSVCSYIKALNPLKDIQPWNFALRDPLIAVQLQKNKTLKHQTQTSENRNQNMHISGNTGSQKLNVRNQSGDSTLPTSIPAEKTNLGALQGTPSSSANHDNRGRPVAGVEAAKGTREHSKETSALVTQTTQESKNQNTTQLQQDRRNRASQQNGESLQSSIDTVHKSEAKADRKQGVAHPSIPSGSPTLMQQDRRNRASPQNTESLKLPTPTVQRSKAEADRKQDITHPSISLDSPVGPKTQELIPQDTHLFHSPALSPQKSKLPQSTTRVSGQESTQSFSSSPKKLCDIKPVDMKAQQDMAKGASKDSTTSSRETRQKSQSIHQKHSNLPRGKRKRSPKRKNWYLDFIPSKVFSSGHYLVVLFPEQDCPDECPTCYCSFYPKMCTVKLSTCVMNFVCPGCQLTVYIVPKHVYGTALEHQSEELARQV